MMQRSKRLSSIEKDPDPNLSPLMKAVLDKNVDLVQKLLVDKPDLEFRDRLGRNILYHTFPTHFCEKSMKILEMILEQGVNVNASLDSDGCSALVTAVDMNEPHIVSLLILHNVDVDDPAMSKFCGNINSNKSEKLDTNQEESANTQFIFSKGCEHNITPLLCAVLNGYHVIAEMLLAAGAGTNRMSSGSFWRAANISVCSICEMEVTPLQMSAYIGDLYMTQYLIDHRNDKILNDEENPCNSTRRQLSYNDITPLWFALLRGHEHIVKLFLTLGKPVAPPCHFGSGLQVCLQEGYTHLAHMILRAGYDLEEDMEWIENGTFEIEDPAVKDKVFSLIVQPRPLLEWCCFSLRERFGAHLADYLTEIKAPKKICDVLTFSDLLLKSSNAADDNLKYSRLEIKV